MSATGQGPLMDLAMEVWNYTNIQRGKTLTFEVAKTIAKELMDAGITTIQE